MITRIQAQKAIDDLRQGFMNWPVFLLIGLTSIKARYRRSKVGQFWITISMAITVLTIGVVWSYLWKMPIEDFLPYIAISYIVWLYMTGVLADGTILFISQAHYLREIRLPKSAYLFADITKHLIILGHNLLILLPVYLLFGLPFNTNTLMIIPAFLLTTTALLSVSMIVAIIGLRYRDVSSMIASIIQIGFFVTPVIWKPDLMPPELLRYMIFNPFAVFLEILRAPMLGNSSSLLYWQVAVGLTLFSLILSFVIFARFRSRITYWL